MTTETLIVAEARIRRDVNSAPYLIRNSATPPSMRPRGSSTPEFRGLPVGLSVPRTTMKV
jgi:hypothetical protein